MKSERKICWRVIRRCNLHCVHCLAGLKNAERRDMTPVEQEIALLKIVEANITRITWTGGEPTLCNSLPSLLDTCHQNNIKTVLTTHGLSLTTTMLSALSPATDSIRFSFDGLESTHNIIRGGSFFQKTMKALRQAKNLGFRPETNICVMEKNITEIPALMKILKDEGVVKIVLMSLMSRESAEQNNVAAPSLSQMAKLHDDAACFQNENPTLNLVINDYNAQSDTYIVVESDGEIMLCSEQNDQGMGNILATEGDNFLQAALQGQTLDHRKSVHIYQNEKKLSVG